ncbi:protein croquemort [Episyrphus balteatus]|uniref:protein croquemort n=1 Tax=Episyrphus balteatus TaxID=286459 RepID=UPI002485B40C|nr:protein croquemort [Episyrphus balteatus]XP_055858747.1 protein croquemort [Episyrphus balteatus]XP_055858748.1 protein croquemort [Episyrphus balteatus]XP_055858749.1 protein croquemort [Episyrphus balteatus]
MCCQCCSVTQRKIWVFGIGTLMLLMGVVVILIWPDMSTKMVQSSLVLKEGTENFENWKETPIPIYTKFTLFNWTNPEEFRNPNVKPNLVEMGPYVFLEKDLKMDLDFHENNTVSYYNRKSWFFIPEMSNGTLDDMVTAAHVITASVADMMRNRNKYVKKIMNFVLNHEGGELAVTKKAGEWIFDGYQDNLIDFLKLFNTSAIHIPYTKFGFLVDRNNSKEFDGRYMIGTGGDDIHKLGLLTNWNGRPTNGFYPGECGKVNGSTGDLLPPDLDVNEDITIYAVDTCRFLNLSPGGKVQVYGLDGYEWTGTADTLDSGENDPEQKCFCNPKEEECPKTGVVDCRRCRNNAPIFASFPHFYLGDQSYVDGVTGIKPVKEKHQFRFAIEPTMGVPLEIHARIQINLLIQPDNDFDIYKGVPKVMMPMFYFEQIAELTESLANRTKLGVNLKSYGLYLGYFLIAVGAIMDIIGIVLTVTKRWTRSADDDEELLTN